jgi:Ca2+-binding EF-hand superfamily protein
MRITVAIAAMLAATPVLAQQIEEIDTDGDGLVTYEEMVAVYPDTTPEAFAQVDSGADGVVDQAELTAAADAGLVPPTGG